MQALLEFDEAMNAKTFLLSIFKIISMIAISFYTEQMNMTSESLSTAKCMVHFNFSC